ncbi:MAG: hypothetical protein JXR58_07070 [Bacteroidales bacterium]|nr:hypothetical protein [Bacteroidales bacterium]
MQFLTIWDFILPPFYLGIIYFFARSIQKKNIAKIPEYKYFIWGLYAKIIGGIGVVLVYCFYYGGGDTIGYFEGSNYTANLLSVDPNAYFSIIAGNLTPENWSAYTVDTGYPMYYKDFTSFSVIRFTSIITFFGAKSFMVTTMLVAVVTFPGIWRLFLLFKEEFPELSRNMAIAILFMPSVAFWGSAILKDAYTLSAAAWLLVATHQIFIKNRKIFINIIIVIVSIYVLISLKPYIFFAVFMGILIMLTHFWIKRIKAPVLRAVVLPLLFIFLWVGGTLFMLRMGSTAGGAYEDVDSMLHKAKVTQEDLKTSERYGENTFDIGSFEATPTGMIKKAPLAMEAGLFRPYLWECTNPVMLISGIENTFLLLIFFYVFLLSMVAVFKIGPSYMVKTMYDNSLVIFAMVFAFSFAFFIGLTTANFGALVRYKIPLIPFLVSALFIIIRKYNIDQDDKKAKEAALPSHFKRVKR